MDSEQYNLILHYLISQSYSGISDKIKKRTLRRTAAKYIVIGEKLYLKTIKDNKPLIIKDSELPKILKELHDDAGHQGVKYTISLAKDRYFWPLFTRIIESYVKNCERCKRNQYSLKKPTEPLKPLPVISRPWYRVGMDLTGPLIESNGCKYILTMVDHFTKYVETRPLRSKETAEVARGVFSIYCSKGAPVQIITDNGKEFTSKLMAELQRCYSCHLIFTTPYHPQTNGLVESFHKGIKSYLCKTLADKNDRWTDFLEQITFSVNIRPRFETTGFSAFELMHGFRKARIPTEARNLFDLQESCSDILNIDRALCEDEVLEEFNQEVEKLKESVFEKASQNLLRSKEKMKRTFDKKLNSNTVSEFKEGVNVLIPNRKRRKGDLEDLWLGPYPVKKSNIETVIVTKGANEQKIKKSQIRIWQSHENLADTNNFKSELTKQNESIQFSRNITEFGDEINDPFLNLQEEIIYTSASEEDPEPDIILDTLNLMKVKIQDSISANTFLSDMHFELDNRQNFSQKDLIEWKSINFPNAQSISCHSEKVTDKLIKWYKEAKKADVKSWLITDEDRANALFWGQKAVTYVSNVLYPVVSDIIASKIGFNFDLNTNTTIAKTNNNNNNNIEMLPQLLSNKSISTNTIIPLEENITDVIITRNPITEISDIDIELLCPDWGGFCKSMRMDNTCAIDNIIAIISINLTNIFNLIDCQSEINISEDCSSLFAMIQSRNFNQVKLWLANKLKTPKFNGNRYDFFGSEGPLIEYLNSTIGSTQYEVSCTCWECFTIEDRTLNLTNAFKFINDCQTTIESHIDITACRLCRKHSSTVEKGDMKFNRLPLLFMFEVGHLSLNDTTVINKLFISAINTNCFLFNY